MMTGVYIFLALGVALIAWGYHIDRSENYEAFGFLVFGLVSLSVSGLLLLIDYMLGLFA